jgi:hypothetical protein
VMAVDIDDGTSFRLAVNAVRSVTSAGVTHPGCTDIAL